MRTEACPVRNQNEQNLFKKQELECVLNLSIVDLRLDVSSMGRKKIQTWSIHGPTRKTSRAILFSWSPPQIWLKIEHFKFNFQEFKNHRCGGGEL